MSLTSVGRKIELGDLLLPWYGLVFIRQYLWGVENEFIAWSLASAATVVCWFAYLYTKPERDERTPLVLWMIVGLPLLMIYAIRAPFPDLSFDVLNHRLIQGERALRGPQLLPGDFFPTIFPFNPASDMLTGMFRHLLGYRLGTLLNLMALIWVGTILEKILRPFVAKAWPRCLAVLLALFTEHVLFEINNYMVDLLALPLILESLRLGLRYEESETKVRDLWWSALLLGLALGLKLTNATMVVPVLAVFTFRLLSAGLNKRLFVHVALAALLVLLPLLPHALYIYHQTGNPVFPLYNNLIRSPLWPPVQFFDGRWGPRTAREILLWPLLSFWFPQRLSELGVYAGRLTVGFAAAIPCLLLPAIAVRIRLIAFTVLLGSLLWSATSGYIRYAGFVEILGGVLVLYLASYINDRARSLPRLLRIVLVALPICLLVSQSALSAAYVRHAEWGGRPTVLDDAGAFRKESRWVWRDRDLMKFQPPRNRQLFLQADAWIVSSVKSNGIEVLLRPDVPMLAVNNLEYFDMPEARRRFDQSLDSLRGRRVYSLTLTDELESAIDFLKRRDLTPVTQQDLMVPFFSGRTQVRMTLIEVNLPQQHETARRPPGTAEITAASAPLNDSAFVAGIGATGVPLVMQPGQSIAINVVVKNLSEFAWPSRGKQDSTYLINVADSWFRVEGDTLLNNLDGRASLPRDIWPGESAEVQLKITAPQQPGKYVLEVDLVQEGVAFFKNKGSQIWRTQVKVE